MQTLKQFLKERNAKIKERYISLIQEFKQSEALKTLSLEFELSTEMIYTIVVRNNKNRAN